MSKHVIKSSPWLYRFYVDYEKWINAGSVPGGFSRDFGLCANLYDYLTGVEVAPLLEEMHVAFANAGLSYRLPFNLNAEHFASESAKCACHLNPARMAWVRARIEDGEKAE